MCVWGGGGGWQSCTGKLYMRVFTMKEKYDLRFVKLEKTYRHLHVIFVCGGGGGGGWGGGGRCKGMTFLTY